MDKLHYIKQLFKAKNIRIFMFDSSDKDKIESNYQFLTTGKYLSTFRLLCIFTFLLSRNMKLPLTIHSDNSQNEAIH